MSSSGFLGVGVGPTAIKRRNAIWYRAGGAPQPIIVYQPKGAASLAASYVNLANPGTYNAAEGTAPTFATATGWTFTVALSQYLKTNYAVGGGFNPQTRTAIVRVADSVANTAAFGAWNGSSVGIRILPVRGNNLDVIISHGGQLIVANEKTPTGVLAVAGATAYKNGAALTGSIGTSAATDVPELYIGAMNNNGTPSYFQGSILAFALYESVLTASQVAAVSAAMAAL